MFDWAYLIPLMGMSIPIVAIWAKHKQKIAEMQISSTANATAEKAAQYSAQVGKLEERVQTLERIVTDRGYNVAAQIEALRDERTVEEQGSGVPLDTPKKEKV